MTTDEDIQESRKRMRDNLEIVAGDGLGARELNRNKYITTGETHEEYMIIRKVTSA